VQVARSPCEQGARGSYAVVAETSDPREAEFFAMAIIGRPPIKVVIRDAADRKFRQRACE